MWTAGISAVLASHWTSRVSDKEGEGRDKYADQIYGRYRAMHKADADVSLLICGDFNDNPDEPSVRDHLHGTGDLGRVKANGDPPLLYGLFAKLWAEKKNEDVGTHFYRGKAFLFDQLVVSPGMVNGRGAWQYEVDTAAIVKHRFVVQRGRNKGHALAFGTEKEKVPLAERGVSDHLPVTGTAAATINVVSDASQKRRCPRRFCEASLTGRISGHCRHYLERIGLRCRMQ